TGVRGWATLTLIAVCAYVLLGCSRSQSSGTSITAQAIAKAMPEFTFVTPPGASNVFLECDSSSSPAVVTANFKMTVPRPGLSNFLRSVGFPSELLPMNGQGLGVAAVPMLPSLDPAHVVGTVQDARHAAAWGLEKQKGPMRMGFIET